MYLFIRLRPKITWNIDGTSTIMRLYFGNRHNTSLNADIKSRDETVSKMEERIDRLEHEIRSNETKRATLEHLSYLNERKIDDQEQVSRKINLRINGIPIKEDETTTSLLGTIKAECERAGVIVDANDFDHCQGCT